MREIELIGHSGCKLKIIRKNDVTLIRKTSSSFSYNKRLEQQIFKQRYFTSEILQTPKIYDVGYVDQLLYFDMEYINGIKFSEYISINKFEDSKEIFYKLLQFINNNFSSENISVSKDVEAKLYDLKKVLNINPVTHDFIVQNSSSLMPSGNCHGDLTFENILIYNNQIYLIDFLDSYISSPIMDIAKLFQELMLNWSNRFKKDDFLLNVKYYYLKKDIENYLFKQNHDFRNHLNAQIIMTLLRILPYSNNLNLNYHLILKIHQIINKL